MFSTYPHRFQRTEMNPALSVTVRFTFHPKKRIPKIWVSTLSGYSEVV